MDNNHRNQQRVSDIKTREHAHAQKMMKRMEDLEKQVKDIQTKLSSAVQLISERDKEIEKLKVQVLQDGVEKLTHTVQERQFCKIGAEHNLNMNHDKTNEKKCCNEENGEGISNDSFFDSEDFETPKRLEETVEERIKRVSNVVNQTPIRSNNTRTFDTTGNKNIKKTRDNNTLNSGEPRQSVESATSEFDQESTIQDSESNARSENEADQELEEDYIRLLGQLEEMEKFLGDYGLIWVGDIEVPGEDNSSRNVQASVGFTPNFNKVIMVISEINERTGSESKIEMTDNIAKFKNTDILKLTIYADGIQLEDNPFREYSSESVQEFFKDLEDGYYPTELKDSYPDGVIFRVIDKRNENFDQTARPEAFSGNGQKLGGGEKRIQRRGSSSSALSINLNEVNQKPECIKENKVASKRGIENQNNAAHKNNPKGKQEIKDIQEITEEPANKQYVDYDQEIKDNSKMPEESPNKVYVDHEQEIKDKHEVTEEPINKVYVDYDQELSPVHPVIEISEPVKNVKPGEVKIVTAPQIDSTQDRKDMRNEGTQANENAFISFRDINITNITYNEAPFTIEGDTTTKSIHESNSFHSDTHQKKRYAEKEAGKYQSRTPDAAYANQRNAHQSGEMLSDSSSDIADNQKRRDKNDNYSTDYTEKINANAIVIEQAIRKRASNQQSAGAAINPNENFSHITLLHKKGEDEVQNTQEIENSEKLPESTSGEVHENVNLDSRTLSNEDNDSQLE